MGTTVTYCTHYLYMYFNGVASRNTTLNNQIIKIRTVKLNEVQTAPDFIMQGLFGNFTTNSVIFRDVRDGSKIHVINVGIVSYFSLIFFVHYRDMI